MTLAEARPASSSNLVFSCSYNVTIGHTSTHAEASRRSEQWGIISGRRSLAYFVRFAQSQFIGPG